MKHLILCREFPPAVYPPGGIGTYVAHISRALAERGETVHVIGERWEGASKRVEHLCDGRLIVHRICAEDEALFPSLGGKHRAAEEMRAMLGSDFPAQWFSWVAAGLAERLVEEQGIDVIEAQEWEAPLYYFLLRRSLGLGPDRKPPCIVHLHSPTELIFRHNDWPLSRPDYTPMKRLEDFSIKAADGHLCPSRFLARQAADHYGLADPIEVIPLPLGTTNRIARASSVWSEGSITFCGRLEPRKGIIEFVEAAIIVARKQPSLRFDFIGSDNEYNGAISVRELLTQMIPADLRPCFRFHGSRPRQKLLEMLGDARIAVVPSRWENFPNTCLEAMCTGLPVLATRNGGMAEMIDDGETGWLAADGTEPLAERLAVALQMAVDTPPAKLQEMGDRAADAIHRLCNNDRIAARHIAYRDLIVRRGTQQSTGAIATLPWPERPRKPVPTPSVLPEQISTAVAIVALRQEISGRALQSVLMQDRKPAEIILVSPEPPSPDVACRHISYGGFSPAFAKMLALQHASADVTAVLFLDDDVALHPSALAVLEDILMKTPAAGLAVPWTARQGQDPEINPANPSFPYQWLRNELEGPALYRAQAVRMAQGFRPDFAHGHEEWDLATAIMATGWAAVRAPALLAEEGPLALAHRSHFGRAGHAGNRIVARFPDLAGQDVTALLPLFEPRAVRAFQNAETSETQAVTEPPRRSEISNLGALLALPLRMQARVALAALRRPDWAVKWIWWRCKSFAGKRWGNHGEY